MSNLEIFCVTDKEVKLLEKTNYKPAAVGLRKLPDNYLKCNIKKNIYYKEKNYSELTFHYWFWKNLLNDYSNDIWIGFCQKRRFWKQNKFDNFNDIIEDQILHLVPKEWEKYDSVICEPIKLTTKFSKLLKRGWKNIIKKPNLVFNHNHISIKEHFDLHHGYGVLEKAGSLLNSKYKDDFLDYINNNNKLNPHIMFISKKDKINEYFQDQFEWLTNCEKIFGLNLKNYDQTRLYGFLAERFLPFWFKKNTKFIEWPWIFYEENNKTI